MERILVGTDDGLFRIGDDPPVAVPGRVVDHVAWPWAIVDGGLRRLDDSTVADPPDAAAIVVLAAGDRVWVGGSEASLWRLTGDALQRVESFDRAPGRAGWYTPWGGPPDVRSLSATPGGPVYVNVHVGGILRSDDGEAWTPTIDVDADVHQVLADPDRPGRVYAATARGLAVTDDGGGSWSFTTEGLAAPYCRAVARSDSQVFVSASRGPRGEQAAVYRRPATGGPLQRCRDGLPEWFSTNVDTHCLVASGELVATADREGTVYVSTDEGEGWQEAASGLPPIRCLAFA